jgi:hypothetical protein
MISPSTKSADCLGFLTVVENSELGLLGGYLLINRAGRPLEFHCTAPIKPNRTQEILYGPTLKPFLYGEQIGQTLLTRSKLAPFVVCTDCEAVIAAREFSLTPLVLVMSDNSGLPETAFALGKSAVVTAPAYHTDEQLIRDRWPAEAGHLDLLEPFTRIREALDEAQRAARHAA